jgi:hypothetical protein
MKKKPKRQFLYLAIACFAGLIAVFILDGYLGVYDTFHVSVGEYPPQTIEADYWLHQGSGEYYTPERPVGSDKELYAYCCIGADWSQDISFEYVIENHKSASYSADVQASLWKGNEKVVDLFSQSVSVGPFREAEVEWVLSSEDLGIPVPVSGQSYDYTVRVNRGDVERRIIVSFYNPQEGPYYKPEY